MDADSIARNLPIALHTATAADVEAILRSVMNEAAARDVLTLARTIYSAVFLLGEPGGTERAKFDAFLKEEDRL